MCSWKAEIYWQGTGEQRNLHSRSGLNCLPPGKGSFYSVPRRGLSLPELQQSDAKPEPVEPAKSREEEAGPLPEEGRTASVLDIIYPRNPSPGLGKEEEHRAARPLRLQRAGAKSMPMPLKSLAGVFKKDKPRPASLEGSRPRVAKPKRARSRTGEHKHTRPETDTSLVSMRKKLLDKFPTMTKAFEAYVQGTNFEHRELSRWEFTRFLSRHFGGLSRDEHVKIFDFLDTDNSGTVSLTKFMTAVEASAPIKTLEDLRRRLVALGWTSMRQVLQRMENGRLGSKRLRMREFAAALRRVGVMDEAEHFCLFTAISDPNNSSGTVSINELSSAMSAVSPSLLLEDIRCRLVHKYSSLNEAYNNIDVNLTDALDLREFMHVAVQMFKMSTHEAEKVFRLIDTRKRRWIGRSEFVCALRLSEPSLHLEEIRRKVRQRFRSIYEALQREEQDPLHCGGRGIGGLRASVTASQELLTAFKCSAGDEAAGRAHNMLSQWNALLSQVELTEGDTKVLWDMIGVNGGGHVTAMDFECGIRLFAPSVILEDLRFRCLRNHGRVADAFKSVPQALRTAVLDVESLSKVLQDLDLAQGVQVQDIVDLIEPSRDEGITIGELIAALQCSSPGVQARLPEAQRNAQAREKVQNTMAPFYKSVTELRAHVRQKPPAEGDKMIVLGNLDEIRAQEDQSAPRPGTEGARASISDNERKVATPPHTVKQSYSKVTQFLEKIESTDCTPLLESVQRYYSSAGSATADDEKLLSRSHSRFKHFQKSSGHYAVLMGAPI